MKYIVINFRGGGKIKIPANILKSIDVPDDFTVNKEGKDKEEIKLVSIGYILTDGEEEKEIPIYIYSDVAELTIGTYVYADENGTIPAPDGNCNLNGNIDIKVPSGVYGFTMENGQVSELLSEEQEEEPEG